MTDFELACYVFENMQKWLQRWEDLGFTEQFEIEQNHFSRWKAMMIKTYGNQAQRYFDERKK